MRRIRVLSKFPNVINILDMALTNVLEFIRLLTIGWVRLIRSLSSATFSFELSRFSN